LKVLIGAVSFHWSEPSSPVLHPLPALYKASKHTQVLCTDLEDGNCSVCWSGQFSTFDVAYPGKTKLYIELEVRKPKDKKTYDCLYSVFNQSLHNGTWQIIWCMEVLQVSCCWSREVWTYI
jgi:hypothetical protein